MVLKGMNGVTATSRRTAQLISGKRDLGTCRVSGGGTMGGGKPSAPKPPMEARPPIARMMPTDEHLKRMGFKRVGASPLYVPESFQGFAFWRGDDGRLEPLVTLGSRNLNPIQPVYVFAVTHDERRHIRFHTLDRQSIGLGSWGSLYLPGDHDCSRDIGLQLEDAGFTRVAPEVYRWRGESWGNNMVLVARVFPIEDKKIVTHVLQTPDRRTAKQVEGLRPIAARDGGGVITMADDLREVDLTPADVSAVRFSREPTMKELNVTTIEERIGRAQKDLPVDRRKSTGGFAIGGVNDTATIRQLSELNGIPIHVLEERMRPHARWVGSSREGFLGPGERLLDVMAQDNDFVRSRGLTHQEIARHMFNLDRVAIQHGYRDGSHKIEIPYGGRRFSVSTAGTCGSQYSPLDDGLSGSGSVAITNLDTGLELTYGDLVPLLIHQYGFYEGFGTEWRVEPAKVVKVLDFLGKKRG